MKYLISVPVTKDAMQRLDYDENLPGDLVEFVLDDCMFKELWRSGIFQKINEKLEVMIDDYESEKIVGRSKLIVLKDIMDYYLNTMNNSPSIRHLADLTEQAIACDTGIFFFF